MPCLMHSVLFTPTEASKSEDYGFNFRADQLWPSLREETKIISAIQLKPFGHLT